MNDTPEFTQDPSMPPDWHCWQTSGKNTWHARPPGHPNPANYVHGESKQDVADKAWHTYRLEVDAQGTR